MAEGEQENRELHAHYLSEQNLKGEKKGLLVTVYIGK